MQGVAALAMGTVLDRFAVGTGPDEEDADMMDFTGEDAGMSYDAPLIK